MKLTSKNNFGENPLLSFAIIDSRSDKHPEWVSQAINSLESQCIPIEIIVIDNIGRGHTIGECWNAASREAKCDWVAFVGDDDLCSYDYARTLFDWISRIENRGANIVNVATYMTFFENESERRTFKPQQSTGAWKKSYLLEHPFNEKLKSGVDREYIEESLKRGALSLILEYYFGYFYRKYPKDYDYSCAGEVTFIEEPRDYYFCTSNRIFLDPITKRFKKTVGEENIIISPHTTPEMIKEAKVIWVEWANEKAVEIQNADTKAYKILRLHAYEAFYDDMKKLDLNKFDRVIFISDYIKNYVEKQYGKVKGAVVIPNGVELDRFTLNPNKKKNNKIGFAGYLTRKKGIGELIFIAQSLPEYEFHLAGRYQEDDICDFMQSRKPDNVFVHEWKYGDSLNDFYQDMSFILNTSLRESQGMTIMEGLSCGCKPIIRNWIGSDKIYDQKWIYRNLDDIKNILEGDFNPQEYRSFVEANYDIDDIYPKLETMLLEGVPLSEVKP